MFFRGYSCADHSSAPIRELRLFAALWKRIIFDRETTRTHVRMDTRILSCTAVVLLSRTLHYTCSTPLVPDQNVSPLALELLSSPNLRTNFRYVIYV